MIRVCEEKKVRMMICENWRWFIWFQVIKQLLSAGRIGELKYARIVAHNSFTIPKGETPPPILDHPQVYLKDMERLIIYEAAIHLIDVFRFLFGEADSVYARIGRMSSQIKGEDFGLIVLNFGPLPALIDASWCSRENQEETKCEYLLIEATQGSIILNQQGQVKIIGEDAKVSFPDYDWASETKLQSHFRLHRHFLDGILKNEPLQTDAKDNIKTLEIALKAYESAQTNSIVTLKKDGLLTDER